MLTFKTREVVRTVATNCVSWLSDNNRLQNMRQVAGYPGDYYGSNYIPLTLASFREYLDCVLKKLVESNIGKDTDIDLGYYKLSSDESSSHIVIKRSSRQLPKLPSSYVDWVDWDIPKGHASQSVYNICVNRVYKGRWNNSDTGLYNRLRLIHVCILSQVLLQCLFNLNGKVDLSSKPLPSRDLRCRVGSYEMLYDHLMQEWRIWKKK